MNKLNQKLNKFLSGRYGTDDLSMFLCLITFIIILINIFFNNSILTIISFIIITLALYRTLSRNFFQRRKENNYYQRIKERILNFFTYQKRKYDDRHTHIYKKCPNCHQKIRLPLKKGKHTVKCPKCDNKFIVKCRHNEKVKVEIVK